MKRCVKFLKECQGKRLQKSKVVQDELCRLAGIGNEFQGTVTADLPHKESKSS